MSNDNDQEVIKEFKTPEEFRQGQNEYRKARKLAKPKAHLENNAFYAAANLLPDGGPNVLNYQTVRFDAFCSMLAAQPGDRGIPYTKEQIDTHPSTSLLSEDDKKALVKYWPKWRRDQTKHYEVIELRKKEVELTTQASKDVEAFRSLQGFEKLPLAQRLNKTSIAMTVQALAASEHLAVTSHEQVFTDEHSQAIFKSRLGYTKEYIGIAKMLADLASRIEQSESLSAEDGQLTQDTLDQLTKVNEILQKKGVGKLSYIDAEVKLPGPNDD